MIKFIIIIAVIVVLCIGVLFGMKYLAGTQVTVVSPSPSITPTSSVSRTPAPGPNIIVDSPVTDDLIISPVTIKGKARTFEYNFLYRLRDFNGLVLKEGHEIASGPEDEDYYHTFEISVAFPKPKGATGSLEVFDYSAKDGAQIDTVVIPVKFK